MIQGRKWAITIYTTGFWKATLEQTLPLFPPKVKVGYCIRELQVSISFKVRVYYDRTTNALINKPSFWSRKTGLQLVLREITSCSISVPAKRKMTTKVNIHVMRK